MGDMYPPGSGSGDDQTLNDVGGIGTLLSGIGADVAPELAQLNQPDDQEKQVRTIFKRIAQAKKIKEKWAKAFDVDRSHDYVKGFQRAEGDDKDASGDRRYQINKILAAMKSKIPRIFYYHPYIRVVASRARADTPSSTIQERADLLQDTINTIVTQSDTRFKPECMLALKEAQWAFGVVEVGYSADWGENPFAQKPAPLIDSDDAKQDAEESGQLPEEGTPEAILSKLAEVPHDENFFVRHIPARQFYVASNDRSATESMDWVAYWEWMYVEDVKRSFENTDGLKPSGKMTLGDGIDSDLLPMGEDMDAPSDMVRVWKYWDYRAKVRLVLAEGHDKILKQTPFDMPMIFPLRLEVMPGEWYPIPPIFSQLTEQDEYNDAREWLRMVRKGTRPRYLFDPKALKPEETEKLATDDFNTMVPVENSNLNAILPVQQPTFSEAAIRTLALAEEGFSEQAASSPQARLTRDGGAPTAREVSELSESGDIRDSYEQQEVADWMANIAKGLLKSAIKKMTLPRWIQMNTDPHAPMAQLDALIVAQQWKQIVADDLEDADGMLRWDVTVDIESMSPSTEAQYVSRIMQILQVLATPGVGTLLSMSPPLLKIVLNMTGIRSSADQQAIQQALQARDAQNMAMAQAGAGGPPGIAPTAGAPSPHPPGPQGGSPNQPQPPNSSGGAPPLPPSVQAVMARNAVAVQPQGGPPS